jgi:hypothetical protein
VKSKSIKQIYEHYVSQYEKPSILHSARYSQSDTSRLAFIKEKINLQHYLKGGWGGGGGYAKITYPTSKGVALYFYKKS